MFEKLVEKKKSSFERKLGSSLDIFLEVFATKLQLIDKEIGGKKERAPSKKDLLRILKAWVRSTYAEQQLTQQLTAASTSRLEGTVDDPMDFSPLSTASCFIELLTSDGNFSLGDDQCEKEQVMLEDDGAVSEDEAKV